MTFFNKKLANSSGSAWIAIKSCGIDSPEFFTSKLCSIFFFESEKKYFFGTIEKNFKIFPKTFSIFFLLKTLKKFFGKISKKILRVFNREKIWFFFGENFWFFFRSSRKNIFFRTRKKIEQSFDVKNSGESIPLLFIAIPALSEELLSFLYCNCFFLPEICD